MLCRNPPPGPEVFPKKCGAHDTDHDKVVALLYHLGITLLFPDYVTATEKDHTKAACIYGWQVHQTHSWVDCGHYTLSQAVKALWPVPQWMHDLLPPKVSALPQVTAVWPQFRGILVRPIFITDGAWYRDHKCGGAIAIGSEDSNQVLVYPAHIPIALDNPYIVELYTAWVLPEALAVHGMLFSLCRRRKSGIYHELQVLH